MRLVRLIFGLGLLASACGEDEGGGGALDGGALDARVHDDASFDAGVPSDGGLVTLCAKYGGPAMIERAIKQHVVSELASDCAIGLHFTMLPANRLARFGDCLAIQGQELFGCPGVKYEGSQSPNGLPCRDMKAAHAGLGLSRGDFDMLVMDVASGLGKAGIARQDIERVLPALTGFEDQIVESFVETPSQACGADAAVSAPPTGGADAGG